MPEESALRRAVTLLNQARTVVCLTGAGVSAESGVATFRDAQTGLWSRFDPRQLASQAGFAQDPGLVWRWYMERLYTLEKVAPNPGHWALADLEKLLPRFAIFTQNIDDLHERAGSQLVHHLHGVLNRFCCNECASEHPLAEEERSGAEPPRCRLCGGPVRPAVVWFGEYLPAPVLAEAQRTAIACDVMLVVGTSGVVYPVAELPQLTKERGGAVIDVNPEAGPIAALADVVLQGAGGQVLPRLVAELRASRATQQTP